MCGFNQSDLVFLNWIIVVAKKILASFYEILGRKLCPIGNKAPLWVHLHIVVSNHKHVSFSSSCRIQSDKIVTFKDLNLTNQKKCTQKQLQKLMTKRICLL